MSDYDDAWKAATGGARASSDYDQAWKAAASAPGPWQGGDASKARPAVPAAPVPAAASSDGGPLGVLARYAAMLTPAGIAGKLFSEEGRRDLVNNVAGGLRGAGSIGASIMWPFESNAANQGRRRAMTEGLADMGADTASGMFELGKLGAEVGGTAGMGQGLAASAKAIPWVARAAESSPTVARVLASIESAGSTVGDQAAKAAGPTLLPRLGAGATNMGARMAGGGINGAATAWLVNPEDAGSGGIIGAMTPPALTTVGAGGRLAASALQQGAAVFSDNAARALEAKRVAAALGDKGAPGGQALSDLLTYYPKGAENIPVSAAGITRNPELAALELRSRLTNPQAWTGFDVRQGEALWNNVKDATTEAADLGARKALRSANWDANWEAAADNIKPRNWAKRMGQLGDDIQVALKSPEASNPQVRNALQGLWDEVVRVGPDFSPAHLQQIRAQFNGRVPMNPANAFQAAPRDAPATISLIQELDSILNASTGGKWDKVRAGYAADSQGVHAAAAAGKVREAFEDPMTGMLRKTAITPDVPQVTQAGLRSAIDRAALPNGTNALSPQALQQLQATLDAIKRQDAVKQIAKSAAGNTGSDTTGKLSLLAQGQLPGAVGQIVGLLGSVASGKKNKAMVGLLSDPDELAQALEIINRPVGGLLGPAPSDLPYRVAPLLGSGQ